MIRARRGALLVLSAILAVAVLALVGLERTPKPLPPRPASARPTLLLLTSLPLMFGEDFSLRNNGSPALAALQSRYRVVPISVAGPAELAKGRLLLMAHPRAQPPEDLVALDEWVRKGGRVLLLADPMLEWPSQRPLGDPLRPPPMFMDTGLLAHWGVKLAAPDERGPKIGKLGGFDVTTLSPGRLSGKCRISSDAVLAHCAIGSGQATIVADADLLNTAALGSGAAHNLDGLLKELAELEP